MAAWQVSTWVLADALLMLISEKKTSPLEGGSDGRGRRRWSEAQKRQIVAEACEPGVSVSMVARRYNLNANQIFRWRRLFREAEQVAGTGRFVPVVIEGAEDQEAATAATGILSEGAGAEESPTPGRIEVVLPGGFRVIVDRAVDGPALARVIAVLERR